VICDADSPARGECAVAYGNRQVRYSRAALHTHQERCTTHTFIHAVTGPQEAMSSSCPTPLRESIYWQIVPRIEEQILSGELAEGSRLLST
jgi:hypothetical protein